MPAAKIFCKDPSKLSYDEACLSIYSHNYMHPVDLYQQSADCYNCDFIKWARIPQQKNISLIVNTTSRLLFRLEHHETDNCSQSYLFEQHGLYGWNITESGCSSVFVIEPPENAYIPLFFLLGVIFLMLGVHISAKIFHNLTCVSKQRLRATGEPQSEEETESPTNGTSPIIQSELIPCMRRTHKTRINSLDTFRGITITMMIFVNYGGGRYWFLKHTPWNGLSVADVIFPWFAWMMGIGIVLSVRSQLRSGMRRIQIVFKLYRRMIRLVVLGIVCTNFGSNDITTLRIPGVLQRLGIAFFVVAFLEATFMKRQPNFQYGRWVIVQDLLDSWIQWLIIIIITATHTLILFKLNVPGCPTGYLGPGGLHDHGKYINCTGGAAGFIDRQVFGSKHIYQHPSSTRIYYSQVPFDPEGLLGLLTTILSVYLGVAAGRVILCCNSTASRVKRWTIYAVSCALVGGMLCGWSIEGGLIPINKNLWSLSFVFVTTSLAFLMLIILFLIVDHWSLWSGVPMAQAGMNAIVLYLGHEITRDTFPWRWSPISKATHGEYLLMNTCGTLLWIFIAYGMARNEFFVTI